MPPTLRDCLVRLEWADRTIARLHEEWSSYVELHPFETRVEPDGRDWVVWVRIKDGPPRGWDESVARVIEDLQAALDYLAYELVRLDTGRDTPRGASRVAFPIFGSRKRFTAQHGLRGVRKRHVRALERVQPYHTGHEPLGVLRELTRAQRHRQLRPALRRVFSAQDHFIDQEAAFQVEVRDLYFGPLEGDTPVARFSTVTGAVPSEALHPNVTIEVVLDHPRVNRDRLVVTLQALLREVTDIIGVFAPEFA